MSKNIEIIVKSVLDPEKQRAHTLSEIERYKGLFPEKAAGKKTETIHFVPPKDKSPKAQNLTVSGQRSAEKLGNLKERAGIGVRGLHPDLKTANSMMERTRQLGWNLSPSVNRLTGQSRMNAIHTPSSKDVGEGGHPLNVPHELSEDAAVAHAKTALGIRKPASEKRTKVENEMAEQQDFEDKLMNRPISAFGEGDMDVGELVSSTGDPARKLSIDDIPHKVESPTEPEVASPYKTHEEAVAALLGYKHPETMARQEAHEEAAKEDFDPSEESEDDVSFSWGEKAFRWIALNRLSKAIEEADPLGDLEQHPEGYKHRSSKSGDVQYRFHPSEGKTSLDKPIHEAKTFRKKTDEKTGTSSMVETPTTYADIHASGLHSHPELSGGHLTEEKADTYLYHMKKMSKIAGEHHQMIGDLTKQHGEAKAKSAAQEHFNKNVMSEYLHHRAHAASHADQLLNNPAHNYYSSDWGHIDPVKGVQSITGFEGLHPDLFGEVEPFPDIIPGKIGKDFPIGKEPRNVEGLPRRSEADLVTGQELQAVTTKPKETEVRDILLPHTASPSKVKPANAGESVKEVENVFSKVKAPVQQKRKDYLVWPQIATTVLPAAKTQARRVLASGASVTAPVTPSDRAHRTPAGRAVASRSSVFSNVKKAAEVAVKKAMTAGHGYAGPPGSLTGGSAVMVEDMHDRGAKKGILHACNICKAITIHDEMNKCFKCQTLGKSYEEARPTLRKALGIFLSDCREKGIAIGDAMQLFEGKYLPFLKEGLYDK